MGRFCSRIRQIVSNTKLNQSAITERIEKIISRRFELYFTKNIVVIFGKILTVVYRILKIFGEARNNILYRSRFLRRRILTDQMINT